MQFTTILLTTALTALASAQSTTVHVTMPGATTTQTTTLFLGTGASSHSVGPSGVASVGTGLNSAAPSNGTIVAPTLSASNAGPSTVTTNVVVGVGSTLTASGTGARSSAPASTAGAIAMGAPMGALAMGVAGVMAML